MDSADRSSIVEALDELPRPGWQHDRGPARVRRGATAPARPARGRAPAPPPHRPAAGRPRRRGRARPRPRHRGAGAARAHPATARAHLDAFADVAATLRRSADRPTLGGFLAWLDAAQTEERGLDKGTIEAVDRRRAGAHRPRRQGPGVGRRRGARAWSRGPSRPGRARGTSYKDGQWRMSPPTDKGWCGGPVRRALRPARRPRRAAGPRRGGTPPTSRRWRTRPAGSSATGGEHGIEEERRLAYVAFTRARSALLLTAPGVGGRVDARG